LNCFHARDADRYAAIHISAPGRRSLACGLGGANPECFAAHRDELITGYFFGEHANPSRSPGILQLLCSACSFAMDSFGSEVKRRADARFRGKPSETMFKFTNL